MIVGRGVQIWAALAVVVIVPIVAAAFSPQLQWRSPVYIASGFAGIIAFCLLLIQPLMIGGYLRGLSVRGRRQIHRAIGILLVLSVVLHVYGLWLTSPPDVIDALTFNSPTPFSIWGVMAMWALFASAVLAATRQWLRLRPRHWRYAHLSLAVVIIGGTCAHALLIEGTMETVSKVVLCVAAVGAMTLLVVDLTVRRRG